MEIAATVTQRFPKVRIQFVSYATGASTLESGGWDTIDLNLPEENGYLATLCRAHPLVAALRPTLVIAHEEFAALPAARMAGIPSIFLSAWLPPPQTVWAESLALASQIVVMGEPGIFCPPHPEMPPPRFVGHVLRKIRYQADDRPRARMELSIPPDATVILVCSGGWATEARAPLARTILEAFKALPSRPKMLLWIAGRDQAGLDEIVAGAAGVHILGFCDPIEKWMAASNVLITKGTRGLSLEAARLGLRSISLSHHLNPIDDLLVARIHSNIALDAEATNSEVLRRYIEQQLAAGPFIRSEPFPDGLPAVSDLIAQALG